MPSLNPVQFNHDFMVPPSGDTAPFLCELRTVVSLSQRETGEPSSTVNYLRTQ